MMDERLLKKSLVDNYYKSLQEVFYTPFASSKFNPYNNRIQSELQNYADRKIERQASEKQIYEESHHSEYDQSLSSSDSKQQLPCLKPKVKQKKVGLPYQIEIKKNQKLIKAKKRSTAYNWFPNVPAAQKPEEIIKSSLAMPRPATCSASSKKNASSNIGPPTLSSNEFKNDPPNSTRGTSKSKRVIMKVNPKQDLSGIGFKSVDNLKEIIEKKKEIESKASWVHDLAGDQVCDEENKETVGIRIETKHKKQKSIKKEPKEKRYERKESRERVEKREERGEKHDKQEKYEKGDKHEKPDKFEKPEKPEKPKKPMPPMVSEIVGKHRSFNLNQLLNNRNNDFRGLMQEYLRRSGLPDHSKIFIINGPYDFLRRVLLSKGWIENTHTTSQAFDLKWTYTDSESDYKSLKPGQFFNHFPNNRELTTKIGLLKNLRSVTDHKTNTDEFYPRSYDLGDTTQASEFAKDYIRTSIFGLLRTFLKALKLNRLTPVPTKIFFNTLRISEKYLKEITQQCESVQQEWEFTEEVIKQVVEFSEKNPGFESSMSGWEAAEMSLVEKAEELGRLARKCYPQDAMEGEKNIWIVKPGLNARGSGVKCMQGLENILECGVHLQARVVQKYIETPLLIKDCKFDIRQWVLVTNYEPLTIYFYNSCYFRICQLPYSLESLDVMRHLANYSLQKSIAKNQEDTVWNLDRFQEYLHSINQDWAEILPRIHYLVIKTLLAVKENIESRPECFELYGFDIILDEGLTPWLLEVNLSPACSERTEWLSDMLQSMATGLIDIVFESPEIQPLYDSELNLLREIPEFSNSWVMLYKDKEAPSGDFENYGYNNLEICGEKLNVKREKMFDKRYALNQAAGVIQRYFRGFNVRLKIKKGIEENVARIIQKAFRRHLAKESREAQVRLVACIRIQGRIRIFLAQRKRKLLKTIKMIKIVQANMKGFHLRTEFKLIKIKRATARIQSALKSKAFAIRLHQKKQEKQSAILIQNTWRRYWAKLNKSAKFIQRFWKKRFNTIQLAIFIIQKYYRGFKSRKLFKLKKLSLSKISEVKSFFRIVHSRRLVHDRALNRSYKCITNALRQNNAFKLLNCFRFYKACVTIQSNFRRYKAKKTYLSHLSSQKALEHSVKIIQSRIHGFFSRQKFEFLKKTQSAIKIQKNFRGYKARKYFNFLFIVNESAKIIQRAYRKYRSYKKFRMFLRIQAQEYERKKRLERLRKEQELRTKKISERLHVNNSMRPPSLKAQQNILLEAKLHKPQKKKSKKKCKDKQESLIIDEFYNFLPRNNTEQKKTKKSSSKILPKDVYGIF